MSVIPENCEVFSSHQTLDDIIVNIYDGEIEIELTYKNTQGYIPHFDETGHNPEYEQINIPLWVVKIIIDHNEYLNGNISDNYILKLMREQNINVDYMLELEDIMNNVYDPYNGPKYSSDSFKMVKTIRMFIDDACECEDIRRMSSTTKSARKL